jgi:hypothetical protein
MSDRAEPTHIRRVDALGISVLSATTGLLAGVAFLCWQLLLIYPAGLTTFCALLGGYFWRQAWKDAATYQ